MVKKVTGRVCEVLDEADFYLILTQSGPLLMCSPDMKLEVKETMLFLNPKQLDEGSIFQTDPKFRALKSKETIPGTISAEDKTKLKKKLEAFSSQKSHMLKAEEKADTTQVHTFHEILGEDKDKPQTTMKCVVGKIRSLSPPLKTQYNFCRILNLKDSSGNGELSLYDYHKRSMTFQEGDVVVWKSLKVTSVKKEDEAYRRLQTTAATKAEKASARVEALFAAVQLGDLATSGIILGVARASPYASCVQCHKKMYIDGCGAVDDPQFSQELLSRPAQCQVCNHTGVPFLNFAALLLVEHGEDMTIRLTAFRSPHLMGLSLPTDVTITRDSLNNHITFCLQGVEVYFDAEFVADVGAEGEEIKEFKSIVFKPEL